MNILKLERIKDRGDSMIDIHSHIMFGIDDGSKEIYL